VKGHVELGRIFGVQVGSLYCWLIVALLLTLSLTAQIYCPNPTWGMRLIWTANIATALLFICARLAYRTHLAKGHRDRVSHTALAITHLGPTPIRLNDPIRPDYRDFTREQWSRRSQRL
jgi:hypothetical protein